MSKATITITTHDPRLLDGGAPETETIEADGYVVFANFGGNTVCHAQGEIHKPGFLKSLAGIKRMLGLDEAFNAAVALLGREDTP